MQAGGTGHGGAEHRAQGTGHRAGQGWARARVPCGSGHSSRRSGYRELSVNISAVTKTVSQCTSLYSLFQNVAREVSETNEPMDNPAKAISLRNRPAGILTLLLSGDLVCAGLVGSAESLSQERL